MIRRLSSASTIYLTFLNCSAPATEDPPNFATFSILGLPYRGEENRMPVLAQRGCTGMHLLYADLFRQNPEGLSVFRQHLRGRKGSRAGFRQKKR